MLTEDYVQKVYAGFLGMNIGIRLGAPLEPPEWTYEKIQEVFGSIVSYVKDYKNFSADDDVNGPVFFIRALIDEGRNKEFTAEDAGKAWLNYIREGIGMIWWGGEGISTEHTAYKNLANGILPPASGSADVNGMALAEQIGGQIFADCWGLLFPDDPAAAARYAGIAASVSHDHNGIYGAQFIAACISSAFSAESMEEVISDGLHVIPADSLYYKAVLAVKEYYEKNSEDFRACHRYVVENWGYDRYPGVCHIIPNACVCIIALLYGKGDFAKTVEIAVMCGWDTDCNAGSTGTIAGVFQGIAGIPERYRKPVNDTVITSSVSGYLNNIDIPTFVKELAELSLTQRDKKLPREIISAKGELFFDFNLPGSTHGFRTDNSFRLLLKHTDEKGWNSPGALEIVLDRMTVSDRGKVYYKPFYRRADFSDEKYKPVFFPTISSGQTVSCKLYFDQWSGEQVYIIPYVRNTYTGGDLQLQQMELVGKIWNTIEFTVPDSEGACLDEAGFLIVTESPLSNRAFGRILLDEFHVSGNASYFIDFAKQVTEFQSVTPFSHHKGSWRLSRGLLLAESSEGCASFAGNYYSKDLLLKAAITPMSGESHCLIVRAEGIMRQYLAGFDGKGRVSILLNDFGVKRLASAPFNWEYGREYLIELACRGNTLSLSIDGAFILQHQNDRYTYGMYGIGMLDKGSFAAGMMKITEVN